VTLSGLLNALDGVAAQHGRIVVMTSNHPERLDPALVRPGRIDVKVELGHADDTQIATMFARFFPAASQAMTAAFVKAIRTSGADKVSMATIQRCVFPVAPRVQG
jgi:chaperone BCS1